MVVAPSRCVRVTWGSCGAFPRDARFGPLSPLQGLTCIMRVPLTWELKTQQSLLLINHKSHCAIQLLLEYPSQRLILSLYRTKLPHQTVLSTSLAPNAPPLFIFDRNLLPRGRLILTTNNYYLSASISLPILEETHNHLSAHPLPAQTRSHYLAVPVPGHVPEPNRPLPITSVILSQQLVDV